MGGTKSGNGAPRDLELALLALVLAFGLVSLSRARVGAGARALAACAGGAACVAPALTLSLTLRFEFQTRARPLPCAISVRERPRDNRLRLLLQNIRVARAARRLVRGLDQEPGLLLLAGSAVHAHEMPAAVQLLAFEPESRDGPSCSPCADRPPETTAPRSQIITVPPPYWPFGIVPSKSLYSIGWSSTWIASRFSPGTRLGPRVTAQLFITPSSSSRKS